MFRFLRTVLQVVFLFFFIFSSFVPAVFAQSVSEILNIGNYPLNYDQPQQIGRGFKKADSIDSCMHRREFNFNELHNIWVEGLVRCKINSKGVLSRATFQGISTSPEDEQACSGRREGQIIVQGTPSEDEARRWSEQCSYLGTLGGAGPVGTNRTTNSNFQQYFGGTSSGTTGTTNRGTTNTGTTNAPARANLDDYNESELDVLLGLVRNGQVQLGVTPQTRIDDLLAQGGATVSSPTDYTPVYDGPGVQVPSEDLVPQGISRQQSLSELIVFYTNASLPYVSVVSVFAFVAAGIFYILSFANEELSGKAKNIMTYVVIGIVIIFSAYTIVNTLFTFITFQ